MPRVNTTPKWLRPYTFHGVVFVGQSGNQHYGDCPWCGKSNKFYVSEETGMWDCKSCGERGNPVLFLRTLWERSSRAVDTTQYQQLATHRRLLYVESLIQWGICQSGITGEWLVPGYGADGSLSQLYRYVSGPDGRFRLLATPEQSHGLHGVSRWDSSRSVVYLCEGIWDAITLDEVLRITRRTDSGDFFLTANEESSLAAEANILAVPGANVFQDGWLSLFSGKRVILLFDNDHPRIGPNEQRIEGAGITGTKRIAQQLLTAGAESPAEVQYLQWSTEKHGSDLGLPDGYDVRDFLSRRGGPDAYATAQQRVDNLTELLQRIAAIPPEWVGRRLPLSRPGTSPGGDLDCLACNSWKVLITACRKAMKWPESGTGLDHALAVMLACITSTRAVGDQLWVKVIGPASCGKTTLCEALSAARKYIYPKDTLSGLTSGYQIDGNNSEDQSLVLHIKDKTLIINDGDTLLQLPNRDRILSQLRAFYGRNLRTQYGNKMQNNYEGYNMTLILCGTESLRSLDTSELGERFLDCEVVDHIDESHEIDVALRVARRMAREICLISDGRLETRDGPEMVLMKRLAGGYVTYLRENAQWLLEAVPDSEEAIKQCVQLGIFVAYMRARPSPKQEEKAQRELGYRLTAQIVRLAKCLAVVLNTQAMDAEVMRRVRRAALDTARGKTLDLVKVLAANPGGLTAETLTHLTSHPAEKLPVYLEFLRRIGVAQNQVQQYGIGLKGRTVWTLTPRINTLYQEVLSIS